MNLQNFTKFIKLKFVDFVTKQPSRLTAAPATCNSSMPKPQYEQQFRAVWLKDPAPKHWLSSVESTSGTMGKCKVCNTILVNRYADLKRHMDSKKHKYNEKIIFGPSQPKLPLKKNSEIQEAKVAEAKLALYICAHTSILQIDYLNDLCKDVFKGCPAGNNLQIHRTKCSNIIKHVLSPHFQNELMEDIGDSPYSLLIDESTDISVQKFLGIIIIYYSKKQNNIITSYLDMPKLTDFNADAIVNAIKQVLHKYQLKLKHLYGIGSDNASVMTGVNNGVHAKIQRDVPHLVLVRYVCHSLQSSSRQGTYKLLYETINEGHEPLKIVQSCQTRWLSIETAVIRILDQWLELKTHFGLARTQERCYTAETLYNMYCNDINYALLSFLRNILTDVQRVNKLFQTYKPTKLFDDMIKLIEFLVNKVTLPNYSNIDIFKQKVEDYIDRSCYLGLNLNIQKLKDNNNLSLNDENMLRERAIKFVVALINQIKMRLPKNLEILRKVLNVSVGNALRHDKPSLLTLLQFFKKTDQEIELIENRWASIHLLKWKEIRDTKQFWCEVMNFKDASGENTFYQLAMFAISLLVLPHSNAEVERLFSQLNIVKCKLRNRLKVDTVTAILTVKAGLRFNKCCFNFELPNSVINKIKTIETYKVTDGDDEEIDIYI
ncbi:unnamed protein product [Brassicogethes aeneus]|uniref:DUF4371 domain-containing protein n=1 Tax=Brassicogethes aeneus TaxID=1431903 RepID=A0A9P0BBA2_BRAAE|nr:unnamed protein product [Brassicogethes aeneus]